MTTTVPDLSTVIDSVVGVGSEGVVFPQATSSESLNFRRSIPTVRPATPAIRLSREGWGDEDLIDLMLEISSLRKFLSLIIIDE